jgi:hypothetical protein
VPELDELVRAFAVGDYARVRRDAPRLRAKADSEDVRRAAAELFDRTRPDRMGALLFGLTAALLAVLSLYWWTHDQAPPEAPRAVERVK